jgi:triacylglycerol lipase
MHSIEERAEILADRVTKLAGTDKVHLVAYSFCGVDARAALSFNGLDANVASLTTLCSPHQGLALIDQA